jgi:hypothetical protein
MQMNRYVYIIILSSCFVCAAWPKEKEAPSWVTEVATRALPQYPAKVRAAVLLDDQRVTLQPSGVTDVIERHAVKILTHDGKRDAEVVEGYEKGGRQVKELHAWLVAPSGFVKTFDKSSIEDLGAFNDELYNDFRLKIIKAPNAEIGSVFVYESEVTDKLSLAQDLFTFQGDLPCLESRYSITVPAGWKASGMILNHEPVQPAVDGTTYSWTLKSLAPREREEAAPQLVSTAPRLAVNFEMPAGAGGPPAVKGWSDVRAGM